MTSVEEVRWPKGIELIPLALAGHVQAGGVFPANLSSIKFFVIVVDPGGAWGEERRERREEKMEMRVECVCTGRGGSRRREERRERREERGEEIT